MQLAFHREFFKRFNDGKNLAGKPLVPRDVWSKMHERGFTNWSKDKFSTFKGDTAAAKILTIDEIAALAQIIGISLDEVFLGERSIYDLDRQADAAWIRFKDSLERLHFALMDVGMTNEEHLRLRAQLKQMKAPIRTPKDFLKWWELYEILNDEHPVKKRDVTDKDDKASVLHTFTRKHAEIALDDVPDYGTDDAERARQAFNLLLNDKRWSY